MRATASYTGAKHLRIVAAVWFGSNLAHVPLLHACIQKGMQHHIKHSKGYEGWQVEATDEPKHMKIQRQRKEMQQQSRPKQLNRQHSIGA
jgi:hypothetical protein